MAKQKSKNKTEQGSTNEPVKSTKKVEDITAVQFAESTSGFTERDKIVLQKMHGNTKRSRKEWAVLLEEKFNFEHK